MPDLPLEQVERLLRECSEFKDFDELLGTVESVAPLDITPVSDEPLQPVRPRGRANRWVVAAALAPALAGSWALSYVTAGSPAGTSASASDTSPSPSSTGQPAVKPFANLEAERTDADGMVNRVRRPLGRTARSSPSRTVLSV